MIKLSNIIKEIKIQGITPEIIEDLYHEISDYMTDNDKNFYDLYNIIKRYQTIAYNKYTILIPDNFDKNKLKQLYHELKRYKNSLNIQEIKIRGNITYKEVWDLYTSLIMKHTREVMKILYKYGYLKNGKTTVPVLFDSLSKNQLTNLYQDLLKIKENNL